MSYIELLKRSSHRFGNITCLGIDPELDRIPIKEKPKDAIPRFYNELFEAIESEDAYPSCVKPNIAFFEQYGFDGLKALQDVIETAGQYEIPIILDAKRGDIGKTASAYARSVFDFWKADAVTVSPYLGSDSIDPFTEYHGKGVYVLVRTSNKSATQVQDLKSDGKPVYMRVAEEVVKWHKPGLGAVVGATYPKELSELAELFEKSGKPVPLLIPGVGSQGGSAKDTMALLKKTGTDLSMHRINSSSAINYAYEKSDSDDYAGEAVKALKALNRETKI